MPYRLHTTLSWNLQFFFLLSVVHIFVFTFFCISFRPKKLFLITLVKQFYPEYFLYILFIAIQGISLCFNPFNFFSFHYVILYQAFSHNHCSHSMLFHVDIMTFLFPFSIVLSYIASLFHIQPKRGRIIEDLIRLLP